MKISIIGGDLRLIRLAEMFTKEKDKQIYTYGLEKYFSDKEIDKNIIICKNIEEIFINSKYIISSIPLSKNGKYINTSFTDEKILIEELKGRLVKNQQNYDYFISGNIPTEFYDENIKCVDLLKSEAFNILNAIPTVEGSIKIVLEEREETIHESTVLICGFGKIGKILCDRFKKLGATVFCAARKESDLTWIREAGYVPIKYDEIKGYGGIFDILINTVPSLVIDKDKLEFFDKDILLIDLASNPGGIDKEAVKEKNLKLIVALGIPGKDMPKTAGRYIKEEIEKLMKF